MKAAENFQMYNATQEALDAMLKAYREGVADFPSYNELVSLLHPAQGVRHEDTLSQAH